MKVEIGLSATGFHWEEFFAAYTVFKDAGAQVSIHAPGKSKPEPDPVSVRKTGFLSLVGWGTSAAMCPETPSGKKAVRELDNVKSFEDIDPGGNDAIYLAGGHGCLFDLNTDKVLLSKVKQMFLNDKIL